MIQRKKSFDAYSEQTYRVRQLISIYSYAHLGHRVKRVSVQRVDNTVIHIEEMNHLNLALPQKKLLAAWVKVGRLPMLFLRAGPIWFCCALETLSNAVAVLFFSICPVFVFLRII